MLGKRKFSSSSSRQPFSKAPSYVKRPRAKLFQPSRVPRPLPGLPKTSIVTMKYCDLRTLTSTSGALQSWNYRANSINDPDSSGGGHQPTGHDQWAQLYGQYVVLSSRLKHKLLVAGSQTVWTVAGNYLNPTTTLTGSDYTALIEQGKVNYVLLAPSTANAALRLYNTYDAKKEYNLADVKDNVSRIGASFGSEPSEQCFYTIWTQSDDLSTTSASKHLIEIEYTVLLSEPKELPQS